jgi:hypothetical protein
LDEINQATHKMSNQNKEDTIEANIDDEEHDSKSVERKEADTGEDEEKLPSKKHKALTEVKDLMKKTQNLIYKHGYILSHRHFDHQNKISRDLLHLEMRFNADTFTEQELLDSLSRLRMEINILGSDVLRRLDLRAFTEMGAIFLKNKEDFDWFLRSNEGVKKCIFFFSIDSVISKAPAWTEFKRILYEDSQLCKTALLETSDSQESCIKIFHENGECINENFLEDLPKSIGSKVCIARVSEPRSVTRKRPVDTNIFEAPCPLVFKNTDCISRNVAWICVDCKSALYHGIDQHFYCQCQGGIAATKMVFQCYSMRHRFEGFVKYDNIELVLRAKFETLREEPDWKIKTKEQV